MSEIWLPIKGFEGLYEVSNLGNVRSLNYNHTGNTNVLKPIENKYGYFQINLWKNGIRKTVLIHRLVAEAFIPNWFNEPCINHRDENPKNNSVDNLEWCDNIYNNNYGTHNEKMIKSLSKTVLQISKTGELIKEWPSTSEVGRNGFSRSAVVRCCNGKRNHHKGYIWKYK